jgi:acylphosphatase
MSDEQRLEALVRGRVQGVGFRHFVIQRALELGLTGYVRNRLDRAVEVVAEGPRAELEQLVLDLHRGPRAAVVADVRVIWLPAAGECDDFRARF